MRRQGLERIRTLQARLLDHYGPQGWWPGESPFEILAGTILVQRTRWRNAELALGNLSTAGLLSPTGVVSCPAGKLQRLIRPAGFYRQKTRSLQGVAQWILANGGIDGVSALPTPDLRRELTALAGVGQETADCILLYVFDRPVFIADAYARRLLIRLGWVSADEAADYRRLAELMRSVEGDSDFFNELHALIVTHGKTVCGRRPVCGRCILRRHCRTGLIRREATAHRDSCR
ncbi:MAG: endonuclease [Gammaproteobacteria bacterium]|jgi:endonuclease-3 related protein